MDAACDQDREYRKKRRCEDFRPLQEKTKRYQIANSPAPITAPTRERAHAVLQGFRIPFEMRIGILEYVENAIKICFSSWLLISSDSIYSNFLFLFLLLAIVPTMGIF